jgi:hypothetical protein
MRSICLIILILTAFSWADPVPPPPRLMHIYMKDGTVDTASCSRIDPDVGITFFQGGMRMKVGLKDPLNPDAAPPQFDRSNLWFYTNQIDSITFDIMAPAAPASGLTKRSAN